MFIGGANQTPLNRESSALRAMTGVNFSEVARLSKYDTVVTLIALMGGIATIKRLRNGE